MKLKLGKTPARKGAISLKFADYVDKALPPPPVMAGHDSIIAPGKWGMQGNDQYGDCVLAGAAHETMLWNKEAGVSVPFSPTSVLSDYSAITGFIASDPSTDKGTDVQAAAKYRQDTGVVDMHNKRHKIGAYLSISNEVEIKQAIHLFGAAGIGIQFPDSAMTQFQQGQDWTVVKGASIDGGHYIPGVTYDANFVYVVTWGKVIRASWAFIKKYMDEGVVYLSEEMLKNGVSLEGFNLAQLQADLAEIKNS